MNIEPHNLIDPLREKFPHLIRHEKLYRMIHRQLMKKWFQYFVLFFIIGSICSIIYRYIVPLRNRLLTVTVCMHSTTWLPLYSLLSMGYELRQLPCNTPAATMPGRHACATCSLFMESSTSWQLSRSW